MKTQSKLKLIGSSVCFILIALLLFGSCQGESIAVTPFNLYSVAWMQPEEQLFDTLALDKNEAHTWQTSDGSVWYEFDNATVCDRQARVTAEFSDDALTSLDIQLVAFLYESENSALENAYNLAASLIQSAENTWGNSVLENPERRFLARYPDFYSFESAVSKSYVLGEVSGDRFQPDPDCYFEILVFVLEEGASVMCSFVPPAEYRGLSGSPPV